MKPIAHIQTDFPEKFGIPRQSMLVPELSSRIIFKPPYRNPEAIRGLEQFSHIWLLWEFSENVRENWTATVQPPRLGGKKRMGVFATRSPFRPNPIGLSCVALTQARREGENGPELIVSGADLMDGTPIYDIKPYLPFCDCHPEATEGYTRQTKTHRLLVVFPPQLLERYPEEKRRAALGLLEQDPRPTYFQAPDRVYGVSFAGWDIKFQVRGNVLTVCDVVPLSKERFI